MTDQYTEKLFSFGRKPVGYLCTATPPEIIYAAGGLPFRLSGTGERQESAEALAHPSLCGFCKSAIAWTKELPADKSIVAVNAASCDGCRRLGPILGTLDGVDAAFGLELPRLGEPRDLAYFADKLRMMHKTLSKQLGTGAEPGKVTEAMYLYKKTRDMFKGVLDAVYQGRLEVESAFDGAEAYFQFPPEPAQQRLSEILAGAKEGEQKLKGPKLVLAGNMTLGPELARALVDAGAHITSIDFCNVERAALIDPVPGDDPYLSLAQAIYARPLCPRFEPGRDWANRVAKRAKDTGADGVVLFSLKFCDNTLFAFPAAKLIMESQNLPILTLEGEYSEGLSGQLSTRIEAFVEMV